MLFEYGTYNCELAYTTKRYMVWNKQLKEEFIGYIELEGEGYPTFRPPLDKTHYTANDLNAVVYFITKINEEVNNGN